MTMHDIDVEVIEALRVADHFTASILVNRKHVTTPPLKSLSVARQAAAMMPTVYESTRRAIVYVVTTDGRTLMVPDALVFPPMEDEPMTMTTQTTAAPKRARPSRSKAAIASRAGAKLTATATPSLVALATFVSNGHAAQAAADSAIAAALATAPEQKPEPTPDVPAAEPLTDAQQALIDDGLPKEYVRPTETKEQALRRMRGVRSIFGPTRKLKNPGDCKPHGITLPSVNITQGIKPVAGATSKGDADMTAKTTKSKARTAVKTSTKTSGRYDWAAAEEAAANGKLPTPPDFSAPTHRYFVATMDEAVKAAKAKDVEALRKIKLKRFTGSPGIIDRYRKLCIKALTKAA